jgi:excisionase family DNA binding protein
MERRGVMRKHRYNSVLTVREVAEFLNIHVNTVRKWSNLGILQGYRIGPRGDRRFRREDVVAFLPREEAVKE